MLCLALHTGLRMSTKAVYMADERPPRKSAALPKPFLLSPGAYSHQQSPVSKHHIHKNLRSQHSVCPRESKLFIKAHSTRSWGARQHHTCHTYQAGHTTAADLPSSVQICVVLQHHACRIMLYAHPTHRRSLNPLSQSMDALSIKALANRAALSTPPTKVSAGHVEL